MYPLIVAGDFNTSDELELLCKEGTGPPFCSLAVFLPFLCLFLVQRRYWPPVLFPCCVPSFFLPLPFPLIISFYLVISFVSSLDIHIEDTSVQGLNRFCLCPSNQYNVPLQGLVDVLEVGPSPLLLCIGGGVCVCVCVHCADITITWTFDAIPLCGVVVLSQSRCTGGVECTVVLLQIQRSCVVCTGLV